jgi:signal transduction histidine kinase
MTNARVIGITGLVAWLMVGAPVIIQGADTPPLRMSQWAVAFVLFGVLFLADTRTPRLSLLALESLCVVVMALLLCDGFEGALMVLIAMRLGSRLDRKSGVTWIMIQTLLLGAAVAIHWNGRSAWLLAPPYFGFQILAFFTFDLMEREVRANAELRALGALVSDASRMAERLRMAQELHDALGHHLTALTLNLEAALIRTTGQANADVRKAQDLARHILGDVRAIVADQTDGMNIARALQEIVASMPRPAVHLEIDEMLRVDDPERGHIILRCVQEIVTNAARHSGADNLWIVVRRRGDLFQIQAHDDGHGSHGSRTGFGLRAMRNRIEGAGGELQVVDGPERGFGVIAVLPLRGHAS